jgi:hypothetical protein
MPKRIKHKKRPSDVNELAHRLVELSTQDNDDDMQPLTLPPTKAQVSVLMAEMGRKGGKIGGKRRLETMTAKERRKVAKLAANARWGVKK